MSGGPRNRKAYEEGQAFREAVRAALFEARGNLGEFAHLTARQVRRFLPVEYRNRSDGGIRKWMRVIREKA